MTRLEIITYSVAVTGRVQGVSFRDWTIRQACQLNISGWVRNRRDGTVEALISGSSDKIKVMLNRLEVGPSSANVTSIRLKKSCPPSVIGFRKLMTV